jgi:hypothetical protein
LLGSGDIAVQPTLVSGTSIKTVNSNSLLGAGDVAVQPTLVSGTNIKTLNSVSLLGSGDIVLAATPSGVSGAIQFSNGSAFASDASNLFWDDTNHRLGVGTNAPSATTHIVGAGNTSATTALILQNSSGLEMLKVTNDSKFKIIPTALMPDVLFIEDFRFPGEKVLQLGTRNNAAHGAISSRSRMFIDAGINAPGEYLIINSASGNSVGINETTPTAKLQIKGSGSTSATTSLLVQNSGASELLRVRDDGRVYIGTTGYFFPDTQSLSIYNLYNKPLFTSTEGSNITKILLSNNTHSFCGAYGGVNGQVGVNTTTPNASAALEVVSTTTGFLPPRMTTTQKNAIASPAAGLVVYDSTTNKLQCYNGSTWNDLF